MSGLLVREFGAAVRRLRETAGWSQEQLAEHAGLNRSYVGEIERGSAIASIVTLDKLARAFGVPVERLLGRAGHARAAGNAEGGAGAAVNATANAAASTNASATATATATANANVNARTSHAAFTHATRADPASAR